MMMEMEYEIVDLVDEDEFTDNVRMVHRTLAAQEVVMGGLTKEDVEEWARVYECKVRWIDRPDKEW